MSASSLHQYRAVPGLPAYLIIPAKPSYTRAECGIFVKALENLVGKGIEPMQSGVTNVRRFTNWRRSKQGQECEEYLLKPIKTEYPKTPGKKATLKTYSKSSSTRKSAMKRVVRVKEINSQTLEEESTVADSLTSPPYSTRFSGRSSVSSRSSMLSKSSTNDYHDKFYDEEEEYTIENYPLRISATGFRLVRTRPLGEGQNGLVALAQYKGLNVAVKLRRMSQSIETFKHTIARELTFASRLSPCRYTNMYIGLLECKPQHIYFIDVPKGLPDYDQPIRPYKRNTPDLYLFKDISTMVICVIIWRSVKSG